MPLHEARDVDAQENAALQRPIRSDAKRNIELVLQTAREIFVTSGVDAPIREIAMRAGVGIGTIYRHYPKRGDLIAAVYQGEIDALASEARRLANTEDPLQALTQWSLSCARFITQKPGLAAALRSNESTLEALPDYFLKQLAPPLTDLLKRGSQAGNGKDVIQANELICAISSLAIGAGSDEAQLERTIKLITGGIARQLGA